MNYVLTPNAVAKLRRAIAPRSGNTGAVAASGRPLDSDNFPPPFTVRWSASANSGAGAWLIWLPSEGESPSPDKLVIYDGEEVTIDGVTAADNFPAGWYTIDDADGQSEEVYLVITVTDSTGAAEAELSETEGQATTGETVYNIKVAAMATDAETGAKSVKQYVDSVVTFGGGGDTVTPDDVSTEFIPEPEQGEEPDGGEGAEPDGDEDAEPDGDEGKLQIKGFKTGTPETVGNLAEYLQGGVALPQSGIFLVARVPQTGGGVALAYMPVSQIFHNQSGDLSVEFVADNDWYTTDHVLRKRLRILNLKTGGVTDKANTTYANGWEVMAETVGISTILARQNGNGNA